MKKQDFISVLGRRALQQVYFSRTIRATDSNRGPAGAKSGPCFESESGEKLFLELKHMKRTLILQSTDVSKKKAFQLGVTAVAIFAFCNVLSEYACKECIA